MDLHLLYRGLRFVWNAEKLVRLEDARVEDETRDAAVGFTEDGRLLFVVHLMREDDTIRIVSARPATAQERRAYEDCE